SSLSLGAAAAAVGASLRRDPPGSKRLDFHRGGAVRLRARAARRAPTTRTDRDARPAQDAPQRRRVGLLGGGAENGCRSLVSEGVAWRMLLDILAMKE